MSRDAGLLTDMLQSAQVAVAYLADFDHDSFLRDTRTQDAVIRRLEIIGEAARYVSPEAHQTLAAIPWPKVIGMRHIAIHHYRKVDLTTIWNTVQEDVPTLVAILTPYLESL
jgi:uncharacterized protein with HEPN domain